MLNSLGKKTLTAAIAFASLHGTSSRAADIAISGLDDITISGWDGVSNDVTGHDDYCIISWKNDALGNQIPEIYDSAMRGDNDGSGNFILLHDSSTATMAVNFTWIHNDGSWQMQDFNSTGFLTGNVSGAVTCADANASVRIKLVIPAGSLATAQAGTYSGSFQVDALQKGGGGQYTGFQNFTVTLPELVQITGLDDITLTGDFGQNIVTTEAFCLFRNRTGGISLTTTGLNDTGNKFNLISTDLANLISYQVRYSQNGGRLRRARPGRTLASNRTNFSGDNQRNCGSGTNTEVEIRILANDTNGKPAGNYSDTLTILVEPD